jgi:hypothetical protein
MNDFKKNGYIFVPQLFDKVTIETISRYFENKIARQEWLSNDNDPTSKYSYYADPFIEVILRSATAEIESIVGEELYPTYSYSRIYQEGEQLLPHVDRPSCEVSVTVHVASLGEDSPIFMQYPGSDPNKYVMSPGDAVIYQGCVVKHWREPLTEGMLNVQFMLHYVKKNGKYALFKYDNRDKLGLKNIK